MTGLPTGWLADLIGRVREIVGDEWEKPPVGRPHVLPLPTAVIAVLFGLRHNMGDEVVAEVFGVCRAAGQAACRLSGTRSGCGRVGPAQAAPGFAQVGPDPVRRTRG